MKTKWECRKCGKSNFVEIDLDNGLENEREKMQKDHNAISPECLNNNLVSPIFFNINQ